MSGTFMEEGMEPTVLDRFRLERRPSDMKAACRGLTSL